MHRKTTGAIPRRRHSPGQEGGRVGVCKVKCRQGAERAFQAKEQLVPQGRDKMVVL